MDTSVGSTTFRVRHGHASDARQIAAMAARMFVDAFASDNDPGDVASYVNEAFSVPRVTADLAAEGSMFLLAYDDAFSPVAPVGYARLLRAPNDHVDGVRPVRLERLYVASAAIGRGHGSALLRACLDEAARTGADTIWLGVWEHNDRARRFYERWGFRCVGEETFVLGADVQTDHLMARPVSSPT